MVSEMGRKPGGRNMQIGGRMRQSTSDLDVYEVQNVIAIVSIYRHEWSGC